MLWAERFARWFGVFGGRGLDSGDGVEQMGHVIRFRGVMEWSSESELY